MSVSSNPVEPLAKSEPPQTLREHTKQVWQAAEVMLHALQPHLPADLPNQLRHAVQLHDVGKVADGFQRQLLEGHRWDCRHEALSAAIALALGMRETVCAAILTHHRSLNHDAMQTFGRDGSEAVWQQHGHKQWRKFLQELSPNWQWLNRFLNELGYSPLPESPLDLPDLRGLFRRYRQVDTLDRKEWCELLLLRGLLMAADHLASGHGSVPPSLPAPRWAVGSWRPFQQRLGEQCGHTLLEAPTGSGKTEAALRWALHNRQAEERIFYVLPTQASINAMTQRLRNIFGEQQVAPLHHRVLRQEFQNYFEQEEDYSKAAQAARSRTDLYQQFYSPIKVLTPFQIVKHLFAVKFFEIGLAEMVGATFIFDEIHAYDARVQALIVGTIRYLNQHFNTKVCFMSATFPRFLKERLLQAAPGAVLIRPSSEIERAQLFRPRHRLQMRSEPLEAAIPSIRHDVERGQRVLVICNRVGQAQTLYQSLREAVPDSLLLHSRFTQRDRHRIERELMQGNAPLLVATQVVEVSLDLSFDTCYTEIAPVDDLLQRFGRVNRYHEHDQPVPVHVCTEYDPEKVKEVYPLERLQSTLQSAPHNQPLTPELEREWIEQVYADGFHPKERKIYEETAQGLQEVLQALCPLYEGKYAVDFDYLFDSVEVVPACCQDEYVRLTTEKRSLQAQELFVTLRYGTLQGLRRQNLVDPLGDTYVVRCRYDPHLGLLTEPEEPGGWIL